jgi:hypothetical protein
MRIAVTHLLAMGAAHVVAMAGTSSVPPDTTLDTVLQAARADAEQRAGAQGVVRSIDSVTWRDGSLGCPQPGRLYTQALVPGWRIRIDAGGVLHQYHANRQGMWLWCPPGAAVYPAPADARI